MKAHQTLFLLFLLLSATIGHGETKPTPPQRPPIDGSETVKIIYVSSPWNKDSTSIDSAFLFMRDSRTGKVVKILLEETEPDSSTFSGSFSIGWADFSKVSPEIYIPPQSQRSDAKLIAEFNKMLNEGKIQRRPVVFKKENSVQIIDVYDTRDQAERALEAYKQEQKAKASSQKLTQPAAEPTDIQLAEQAKKAALLNQLAAEAAAREAERIRLEQLERQKALERQRQAEQLAAAEKARRRAKAQELANKALAHYQQGQFVEAEDLFRQSVELDPTNKSYYFKYGVTLYRNQKFNEALVTLKISETTPDIALEKKYYMGLIHYRLKELDPAIQAFDEVGTAKHPELSPSALFYKGVILFGKEDFEPSKAAFEMVIDTSNDSKLDQMAEEYLDKIARIQQYKAQQGKKHILKAVVGAMYDSNILYAPDTPSSQGTATDKEGYRLLATGDYEYRFKNTNEREFSGKLSALYMYSLDSQFTQADPMQATVYFPYAWKGTTSGKGYKLTVSPGYETLYMDVDKEGTRENILTSIVLKSDVTLVMRDDWFANYSLEVRQDDSLLEIDDDDDNADAMKYSLKTTHSFFRDKEKKTALIATGGLIFNAATGANKLYHRLDAGILYTAPFKKWDASWNSGISFYYLTYPDISRIDQNLAISWGFDKPVKEWLSWGVLANYTNNHSNTTDNHYSKYTVMALATFRLDK